MDKIGRLRALENAVELVAKANVPELEPFGGEVSAKDGDVVADCYYNAAHENDAEDVSRAIASAVNFIREHGSALIAELGQEVGAVAYIDRYALENLGTLGETHAYSPEFRRPRDVPLYTSPAHTSEARDAAAKFVERVESVASFLVGYGEAAEVAASGLRGALFDYDAAMRQEAGSRE